MVDWKPALRSSCCASATVLLATAGIVPGEPGPMPKNQPAPAASSAAMTSSTIHSNPRRRRIAVTQGPDGRGRGALAGLFLVPVQLALGTLAGGDRWAPPVPAVAGATVRAVAIRVVGAVAIRVGGLIRSGQRAVGRAPGRGDITVVGLLPRLMTSVG